MLASNRHTSYQFTLGCLLTATAALCALSAVVSLAMARKSLLLLTVAICALGMISGTSFALLLRKQSRLVVFYAFMGLLWFGFFGSILMALLVIDVVY